MVKVWVIGYCIFVHVLLTSVHLGLSASDNHTEWQLLPGPDITNNEEELRNQSRVRRVVGGESTNPVYEFMGGLLRGSCEVKCGVTVLDQLHVITAAHCVVSGRPHEFQVLVGTHNLKDCERGLATVVPVSQITPHPGYKGGTMDDLAILKLARPLDYSRGKVRAACLPRVIPPNAGRAKFLGWGSTNAAYLGNSILLQKGYSSVLSHVDCRNYVGSGNILSGRQFCIAHRAGVPCHGDSGGPVVIEDNNACRYSLLGVISSGPRGCSQGAPSICTGIAPYIPWIQNTMGRSPSG